MKSGIPMLMGYDVYGNAREWREMIRLESTGHGDVRNKVVKGVKSSIVKCDRCGESRCTLINVDDCYLCKSCHEEVMTEYAIH